MTKNSNELYLQYCNQLLLTQISNDERKGLQKVLESREVISGKEADTKRKSDGVS